MLETLRNKLFGSGSATSKKTAKSRLHFVLVQDRTGLTSEEMSSFKEDLVKVMERYFIIDKSGFDIAYERDNGTTTLLINSPVLTRRQDSPDKKVGSRHNHAANHTGRRPRRKRKMMREQETANS